MIVAQISDPHVTVPGGRLFGGYDPEAALTATLARVAALAPRPDVVLLTGDLTEHGGAPEYANLRRILAGFDLPMAAIPGNHDRRAAFVAGLAGTGVAVGAPPFLHLVVEGHPLRLIGLDTLAGEGEGGGLLCEARLGWLAARLAEAPDRPTPVFMHHPPFRTGIDLMDAIGCGNGAVMAEIVARHPCVLRVVCGHVHRTVTLAWAGTVAGVCPSVAPPIALDLAPGAPPRLLPGPPGFQLHAGPDGDGLVTHTEHLSDAAWSRRDRAASSSRAATRTSRHGVRRLSHGSEGPRIR